ncbi:Bromodomain-containing protein 4B [Bienertia sinuspersici]
MKRKRGHKKKGKKKKQALQSQSPATAIEIIAAESPNNDVGSANTDEENSGSEEENDTVEEDSKAAIATMTTMLKEEETPQEKKEELVKLRTDGVFARPPPTAVYGRVKVKLKQKPPLETKVAATSEGQNQSDVEKSSQVVDAVENKTDKNETCNVVVVDDDEKVENSSKKSGCIKIVSSKNSSPSGGKESGGSGLSSEEKKMEEGEAKSLPGEAKCNKQELEASLEVVKKIMKMDAAEPFNVPVDPIKLGIPDYFDVIDTPMDFGTIRSNLESGTKYMDSGDVYKDVQYIWDNCYKYNNKGDYIVDLMKRVKKNFMKYWVAAGLYNEQSMKLKGDESSPMDETATSGQGKKLKKGKGVKRHKDDCLCAICIMKRRRREREAREAQAAREAGGQVASPQIKVSKAGLPVVYKQEDMLHTESPVADTSSYMETSHDGDADAEMEDREMRPDAISSQCNNDEKSEADRAELYDKSERSDVSGKSLQNDKGDPELHSHIEARIQDESGNKMKIDAQKPPVLLPEGQTAGYLRQRNELLELEKKRQKLRMLETFRDLENPMLLALCGTIFPNSAQSVWNGANSLVQCKRSCHRRDIHEAVASFMNPP